MINVMFYDAAMQTEAIVQFDNHETLRMAMLIVFDKLEGAAIYEEMKFKNGLERITVKDRRRKILQSAEFPIVVVNGQMEW